MEVMASDQFFGFLKYEGPAVEGGKIDIEKAGKALLAFGRIYKNYSTYYLKLTKDQRPTLKFHDLREGSIDFGVLFDLVQNGSLYDEAVFTYSVLKGTGIDQFGKSFFSTLGHHVALGRLSKGKSLKEGISKPKAGGIWVEISNEEGEKIEVPAEDWSSYKFSKPELPGLMQLEKDAVNTMKIGYKEKGDRKIVAEVTYMEKEYFDTEEGSDIGTRMAEPFDEAKAFDCELIGVFVDYYGLAHKYHFSFQARKKQEEVGKQKILCIVNPAQVSQVIDYLKPERNNNIKIVGKAVKDAEGRVDKIKVEHISEDLNFNPRQSKMNF